MTDGPMMELRRACRGDSADLLAWRNDPETRANSRNTEEIDRSSHEAWLAAALQDADRRIWIAERGEQKLGTIAALRRGGAEVELSITVAPASRGRGESAGMIRAAVSEAARIWPDATVRAVVRTGNAASRRSFERCGFVACGERDGFLVFERPGNE